MKMVLQKAISASGYCSRRKAEEMIRKGQVSVNGRQALIGDQANPENDIIIVKNKVISKPEKKIYLKLNKPAGYTCTNRKFPGEKNIFSLISLPYRLFTIGRLDKNSRGLIILTNDGDLTQRLAHPRFKHSKLYQIKVRGEIRHPKVFINKIRKGIDIGEGDGIVSSKKVEYLGNSIFTIAITSGKKRQIRRMFKILNLEISDLKRISFGRLGVGGLKEGQWAYLSKPEIDNLSN